MYVDHVIRSVCVTCRRFVGEYVPQIVFKNPRVSLFSFKNEGHTPHIKVYLADGSKLMVHCEDKRSEVILEELSSVSGKPECVSHHFQLAHLDLLSSSQVQREQAKEEPNMANFGDRSKGQFCICEVPGQTPCPKLTPISNVHHKWHEQATAS